MPYLWKKKATHSAHNRCPINFVVGGLPLTATITVVKGCWRPSREDVRERGEGRSPLSLMLVTRHFISTTSSQHCHLYTEFAVYRYLFLFVGLSSLFFFSLPDLLQPSLVATTHYMRTIDMRSLEFSPFVSVEMQRRSFSLFLVLCSLDAVIVGDIIFTVAILVIYERFVVMHSMWKTKSWCT